MIIKEIVKQTGLTEKTIRYYEEQDFIHLAMEMKNGGNLLLVYNWIPPMSVSSVPKGW